MGDLGELQNNDNVAVAVDPIEPNRAMLDTVSSKYSVTLSLIALTLIFIAILVVLLFTGRLSFSQA
jgi:nitrogen fixation/metabolism regulation signal transduction histidine kinase